MAGLESGIASAVADPEVVVQSLADPDARLYYRMQPATRVGDKYLCVVVKWADADAFVVTAYLTDAVKRGTRLWPET